MPAPSGKEKGARNSYKARYRVNIGPCDGLDLSEDPSTVADTALRDAINVRVHDGIVVTRGGQSSGVGPQSGCIQGMVDIPGYGARLVLVHNEHTQVGGSGIDIYLESSDTLIKLNVSATDDYMETHTPTMENEATGNYQVGASKAMVWWNGSLIFQGQDKRIYKMIFPEEGEPVEAQYFTVQELFQTQNASGTTRSIHHWAVAPGVADTTEQILVAGTSDGTVLVYEQGRWTELYPGLSQSAKPFFYQNRLYVAGDKIMAQVGGWQSGGSHSFDAWQELPLPVTLGGLDAMDAIEWNGKAYIGGFDPTKTAGIGDSGLLLSLDSTNTVTLETDQYGGIDDHLKSVDVLRVFDGKLWAGFRWVSSASGFAQLQEWTGSAWGASLKNWGEAAGRCQGVGTTNEGIYYGGYGDASNATLIATRLNNQGGGYVTTTLYDFTLDGDSEAAADIEFF